MAERQVSYSEFSYKKLVNRVSVSMKGMLSLTKDE
jgi:hypothetical protein